MKHHWETDFGGTGRQYRGHHCGDISIPFECISEKCSLENLMAVKVRRSPTAVSMDNLNGSQERASYWKDSTVRTLRGSENNTN